MMEKRYELVIDNGQPTFYDLELKEILTLKEVEEILNAHSHKDAWDLFAKEWSLSNDLMKKNKYFKEENARIKAINKKIFHKVDAARDYINNTEALDVDFLRSLLE